MPTRTLETGALLGVALDAAMSIKAPPRSGGQVAALISIVFAVVALEAFVNETTELAIDSSSYPPQLEATVVSVFADCMVEAEKSRASLESKFLIATWILSGKRLDKGSEVYQDFLLLLQLRNDLMHFKANDSFEQSASPEEVNERLLRKFRSKNILAENLQAGAGSWTFLVETKATAEWACKTTAQMIAYFCARLPQGALKAAMSYLEQQFDPKNLFK